MNSKKERKVRKLSKSKEWIYQEYVVKNRPSSEVAKECGLTIAGLKSVLIKYGIKKEERHPNPEEIAKLLKEGKSVKEITKIIGFEETSIYRIMKKYNLHINYKPDYKQYDDSKDELICSLYLDGYSSVDIAKAINSNHNSVILHLRKCGIPIRTATECQYNYRGKEVPKEFSSYDTMYDLYITQRKTRKEIAQMFDTTPSSIKIVLKKLNIPIRNNSESKRGLFIGPNAGNWRGGLTPLSIRIREVFQLHLIPIILKRDNYTCQICGSKKKLHVHHIKHFKDILEEIMSEHPDMNPTDNQEELYQIAIKDSRFLDLDNLITYCSYCHYNIAHGRKNKDQ